MSEADEEAWNLAQIRQQSSRRQAKPISSVIKSLMTRRGYGQTQAVDQLAEAWRAAVGEPLCRSSRPGNITRGVLLVHVADSSTMQELVFEKARILRELKVSFPQANIRDFRATVSIH